MSKQPQPPVTVNSWLEDELYQTYLHDRANVDQSWNEVFRTRQPNGHTPTNGAPVTTKPAPPPGPSPAEKLLATIDPDELTPKRALELLYELKAAGTVAGKRRPGSEDPT